MRIAYYEAPEGNVGDELNRWLWPRLFGPDFFDDDPEAVFIGIGSVLDRRHDAAARRIVFGAGARARDTAPDLAAPGWDLRFVRGPRTAAALGRGPEAWIGDPAILTPLADPRFVARGATPAGAPARIGFVPYFRTPRVFAEMVAAAGRFVPLPPSLRVEDFLERMLSCDAVVAEAMHGAILADAFGLPWTPCRMSNATEEGDTHAFKWADWMEGAGVDPVFADVAISARDVGRSWRSDLIVLLQARRAAGALRRHIDAHGWTLSDRDRLTAAQRRMMDAVARLKAERGAAT